MKKLFLSLLAISVLGGTAILQSCSSDDDVIVPTYEPPTLNLKINSVERTEAEFTITSTDGADYAYVISEKTDAPITDAQELFDNGNVGLLEGGKADITTHDIEGGKEYVVYAAVRKINPYTYSDVTVSDLSTNIPYSNIVTLDKIGLTDLTYHVEVPAGKTVKHVVVKEADYIGIKNILGSISEVTEDLYLKVFGHATETATDMTLDKLAYNALDSHVQIHTGTTYYLMGGIVGDDGEIEKETFECIKFDTRKADKSPYKIGVTVEPGNTSTKVTVTPDPEIVEYRILIESRAEFDYALSEGEAQMRNLIVGFWDDERNSPKRLYTGSREFNSAGMIPNTEYVVGVIGYDDQRRETLVRYDFVTGEPTGPAPTIEITDATTSGSAWSSKAYNVKVTGAEEVIYGYFVKSQVDQLVFNGSSMTNIISANGTICDPSTLIAVSSSSGAVFETTTLEPQTEYTFGVYARSNEYVTAVAYENFTTSEMLQTGGLVRKNMPGRYTAATTDFDGNPVTFPVTITTGVNQSTTNEYESLNRLVALGFGPASALPYCSPEDLIAAGYSAGDANQFYGPKWFFEFSDDGVTVPGCNKKWSMGKIDGNTTYMMGRGIRLAGSRVIEYTDDNMTFNVDVSDDYNTITIHGNYHGKIAGKEIYKYPAMYYSTGSGWTASNTILFAAYSDIVLTRDGGTSTNSARKLVVPTPTAISVGTQGINAGRADAATRIR